jgi:hypothetical protein
VRSVRHILGDVPLTSLSCQIDADKVGFYESYFFLVIRIRCIQLFIVSLADST